MGRYGILKKYMTNFLNSKSIPKQQKNISQHCRMMRELKNINFKPNGTIFGRKWSISAKNDHFCSKYDN